MKKAKIYTWGAEALITAELPNMLKDAMRLTGWNAFGIYELVKDSIRKDKRRAKKEKSHNAVLSGAANEVKPRSRRVTRPTRTKS